jgi:hypothetical protein
MNVEFWHNFSLIWLSIGMVILARWCRSLSRDLRCVELWIILNDRKINPKNDEESPSDLAYMKEKGFL